MGTETDLAGPGRREPAWREALLELCTRLQQDHAGTPELIDWAVLALDAGQDSPALRRLAGLYARQPLSDAAPWFARALQELGLALPEGDALLADYSALLALRILVGEQEPLSGLARLSKLAYARHVGDPLLRPLCDLHAAAELQADELGSYAWLYPEFDTRPLSELIQAECQLYLALRARFPGPEAAEALLATSWCLACGKRAEPVVRPAPEPGLKRFWRILSGEPQARLRLCPACGSTDLLPLSSQAARRRFLANESMEAG